VDRRHLGPREGRRDGHHPRRGAGRGRDGLGGVDHPAAPERHDHLLADAWKEALRELVDQAGPDVVHRLGPLCQERRRLDGPRCGQEGVRGVDEIGGRGEHPAPEAHETLAVAPGEAGLSQWS
jgi:hypothetical protein